MQSIPDATAVGSMEGILQRSELIKRYGLEGYISVPQLAKPAGKEQREALFDAAEPLERFVLAEQHYPKIDPSFLAKTGEQKITKDYQGCTYIGYQAKEQKWRDFKVILSTPLFAVYQLSVSPLTHITAFMEEYSVAKTNIGIIRALRIDMDRSVSRPQIPDCLKKAFFPLFSTDLNFELVMYISELRKEKAEDNSISFDLHTMFNRLIPSETKAEVRVAKKLFGEQVYVVAEAQWEIQAVKPQITSIRDHLVIGTIGERCYLIDAFNCTPAEDYVKQNF